MKTARLDVILVERALAESREKAQRLILAGQVRVRGQLVSKAAQTFPPDCEVAVDAGDRFVSRGGEKLQGALDHFQLVVRAATCLDIGASTGGFTDCLLQNGARKVIAVDVGRGQLHWKLREDPRVSVMEAVNARYLTRGDLADDVDFVTVDVSFISLTLILPVAKDIARSGALMLSLIKPQFEAGRAQVGKGGVVRDGAVHDQVIRKITSFGGDKLGLECRGVCESPLRGPAGNIEFFACWKVP